MLINRPSLGTIYNNLVKVACTRDISKAEFQTLVKFIEGREVSKVVEDILGDDLNLVYSASLCCAYFTGGDKNFHCGTESNTPFNI